MNKKQVYKWSILISVFLSILGVLALYYLFSSEMRESLIQIEGAWFVLIIILIRICVLSGMTFYIFRQWFNQEQQYLSDIPFLFGLFFIVLTFGKALDILINFTYYTLDDAETFLILLKIRHFVIVLTLIPMLFLSIEMILFVRSLKETRENLKGEKYRDKIRIRIIILILVVEFIVVALYPNTTVAGIVMAIIIIPSLIAIVWMFYFAYKNRRLSQVHPLILSIGFGLYLISQIIRPLVQNIIGEIAMYIIISEIVDLIIFINIFIGFVMKVKYSD